MLSRNEHRKHVPPLTAATLEYFLEHANHVVSKDKLKGHVWPGDARVEDNAVAKQVSEVRQVLKVPTNTADKPYIKAEYKVGWTFVAQVQRVRQACAEPHPHSDTILFIK